MTVSFDGVVLGLEEFKSCRPNLTRRNCTTAILESPYQISTCSASGGSANFRKTDGKSGLTTAM
jgi:hypothetical protein